MVLKKYIKRFDLSVRKFSLLSFVVWVNWYFLNSLNTLHLEDQITEPRPN